MRSSYYFHLTDRLVILMGLALLNENSFLMNEELSFLTHCDNKKYSILEKNLQYSSDSITALIANIPNELLIIRRVAR